MDRLTALFNGRLGIQQRALTPYRANFFDALANACSDGLSIFAGMPLPEDTITTTETLHTARLAPARNLNLLGGPFYLCYQRGLLEWLADWDPAALILEANQRYLSTPGAVRWMKQRRRPVLGWGLGAPQVLGSFSSIRNSRRSSFVGQFDGLLTYSRRGAEEYTALGFPAERIFIVPNAVSPRPISPLPMRPPKFDGQPCVLFVGRLQARKRIDTLLKACAALAESKGSKSIQPRLVIVGDGPERIPLEKLAGTIYPKAEFPGDKRASELVPYFLEADLFVLPGTGGLAVQEAMSYGLPVIMGQGDGTNDDLVRPYNGWQLISPEMLTQVLEEALSDAPKLRAMGAESYRIAAEEINLERMVETFVQAVSQIQVLVSGHVPSPR